MQSNNNEWTILEKLLLTQAVHKYGENMWFQVARILKQHELIQQQGIKRPPDFYSQKNCSFQYYLLVEHLESETHNHTLRNELRNDMPVVVRLARHLYAQRIEELKDHLRKNSEDFSQLAEEVNSIRSGKWDDRLQQKLSQPSTERAKAERNNSHQDDQLYAADEITDDLDNKENKPESAGSSIESKADSVISRAAETDRLLQQKESEDNKNSVDKNAEGRVSEEDPVTKTAIARRNDVERVVSQPQ